MLKICRHLLMSTIGVVLAVQLATTVLAAQETEDSQLFIAGFNSYQQRDYSIAIARLSEVLQRHPETPLRDMTLFWLARSHYKAGNQQEAARYLAQFSKEYPDNPLINTVEDELQALATKYAAAKGPESAEQLAKAVQSDAAAKERLAVEQAERERIAREKLEADKALAMKAEKERLAKEDAERQKAAAAKAEADRLALEKVAADKLAKEQSERESAEKADKASRLKAKAEADRQLREQQDAKRLADLKATEEKKARERQEVERLATLKAEESRIAAEKAAEAKQKAAAELQARKAKEQKAQELAKADRAAMREKAIAEYKSIIERFPGTKAANTAAQRLKDLGVAVVVVPKPAVATVTAPAVAENAQILTLEVAQYAAFEFTAQPAIAAVEVAKRTQIPFEIVNRGNGRDSFFLASGFPADFSARFVAEGAPDQAINQTTPLAPGERFRGFIQLSIPAIAIDGLKIVYPIKAASQFMQEASQSREIALVAAAPLLRAVVKTDKAQVASGEKVQYKVAMLNVGSTAAQGLSLRISYPAQYEPVDSPAAGFRKEMDAALVLDGVSLKSGESREYTFNFQLKEGALAKEELVVRADLINAPLQTRSTFLSNSAFVLPQSGVAVKLAANRTVVIPGQVVTIPATIVNTGNVKEKFNLVSSVPSSQRVTIYLDQNRDGLRQATEPAVTVVGPLGPKEEAALVIEIATSANAQDGSEAGVSLSAASESGQGAPVVADARLVYARPVVQLAMKGRDGRLVPGELVIIDLAITNRGSNMAKTVELQTSWPQQMELVTAEPSAVKSVPGGSVWSFKELGAGEKRVVKVSFRVRPDTGVGTGLQLKSVLSYQDQMGNRY